MRRGEKAHRERRRSLPPRSGGIRSRGNTPRACYRDRRERLLPSGISLRASAAADVGEAGSLTSHGRANNAACRPRASHASISQGAPTMTKLTAIGCSVALVAALSALQASAQFPLQEATVD